MILELDAGNSRIKWRLLENGSIVGWRGASSGVESLLAELPGMSNFQSIERIRGASVRDGEWTAALTATLQNLTGRKVELAQVTSSAAGVENSYSNFSTLGVDRWLSMLAAYNRSRTLCAVLSCGTAITVDIIDAGGMHLGGYILPGLSLQRRALLANTSIPLALEDAWPQDRTGVNPGRSTSQAVDNGILAVLASGLLGLPALAPVRKSGLLYLTGGDAPVMSAVFDARGVPHTNAPDIVLDGLAYALP